MRYMLLMRGSRSDWRPVALILQTTGELVSEEVLTPLGESPLSLTGYWLIDCETPARAIEIAAWVSASCHDAPIELRPVLRAPGEEM